MLRILIDIGLAILASLDRAFSDAMPELMCRLYNEIFYAIRRLDRLFFEHTLTLHIEAKKVPNKKNIKEKKEKKPRTKRDRDNWLVHPDKQKKYQRNKVIRDTKKVIVRALVELAKSPCSDDIAIIKSRAEVEIPEFYSLLTDAKSLSVCNLAGYIKYTPLNYPNEKQIDYIRYILEKCFGTMDINTLMRPRYSQIVIEMLSEAFDEMDYERALKRFTNQNLVGKIEEENIDLSEYKISKKHDAAKQNILGVFAKLGSLPLSQAECSVAYTLVMESTKYQGVVDREKSVFLMQFILQNHLENKNDYDFDSFVKKVAMEIEHAFMREFLKCTGTYEIRDFCRKNDTSIVGMLSFLAKRWLKMMALDWTNMLTVFRIVFKGQQSPLQTRQPYGNKQQVNQEVTLQKAI
jgi:hypothetical protein